MRSPTVGVLGLARPRMPQPPSRLAAINAMTTRFISVLPSLRRALLASALRRLRAPRPSARARAMLSGASHPSPLRRKWGRLLRLLLLQMRQRDHLAGASEPGIAGTASGCSRWITACGLQLVEFDRRLADERELAIGLGRLAIVRHRLERGHGGRRQIALLDREIGLGEQSGGAVAGRAFLGERVELAARGALVLPAWMSSKAAISCSPRSPACSCFWFCQ
jgi:hypothetical protein